MLGTEAFRSILEATSQSTIFIYSLALAITVYNFRKINSTVLCFGLVLISQSIMHWLEAPLLELNSILPWYGSWIFINGFTVYLLYTSHKVLKINLAQVVNRVATLYLLAVFVQVARFIDIEHFDAQYLKHFYYLGVNTVNICLGFVILITAIKDKEEKLVGLHV